jgi:hypothetical protein
MIRIRSKSWQQGKVYYPSIVIELMPIQAYWDSLISFFLMAYRYSNAIQMIQPEWDNRINQWVEMNNIPLQDF